MNSSVEITRTSPGRRRLTHKEWIAEGRRLFGDDTSKWRFVCPGCKHVASVADYLAAGAPETVIAYSCVGRWTDFPRDWMGGSGPGPCNYAGGGLFQIHPLEVEMDDGKGPRLAFAFADPTTLHTPPATTEGGAS